MAGARESHSQLLLKLIPSVKQAVGVGYAVRV
jgi:hypothetical protein